MTDKIFEHKNFESDTVHGHNFYVAEQAMHPVGDKKQQSEIGNANKHCDEYDECAEREVQKKKEDNVKEDEYRDYLLQQIDDKEKRDNFVDMSWMDPFNEESLNANDKYMLKRQKQKETRQDLDDCIQMKQDMKLESQRTEIDEARERSEFLKKKHNDGTTHTLENADEENEIKKTTKNDVALLRMAEKCLDVQRDKYIDALIEENSINNLKNLQQELLEMQKSISIKKELFEENEEKIKEWTKNLDLLRKEQEKLEKDIEHEEELEQKLEMIK